MTTTLSTGVTVLDIFLTLVTLLLVYRLLTRSSIPKGLRLPPGPPGKPIIGNLTDMPKQREWATFARWAKEYNGDLIYMNAAGQRMICVHTEEAARDLFELRSSIYSDRWDFPMLVGLAGLNWTFFLMPYGTRWRRHRKMFHQHFNPTASAAYHDIQIKHTRDLLRRLHKSPEEYVDHLRHLAGATIMEIVYGIKVLPTGDPYIGIAEKALAAEAEAGNPGTFLVDNLPILKYVPEWFPGAGFRKKAREWRAIISQMPVLPFLAAKKQIDAGTAGPSVTASLLEKLFDQPDAPADEEEIISNTAASAYNAGADTTVSALRIFVLAMVLYPEAQKKAQAELDSVIGMGRLPSFEDRDNLPYTNALCKEVHRWHTVVPLGVSHRVMQDDVYRDYFIPRGSIVFGNAWAMLHDEKTYGPETDEFRPERFLVPGVRDPTVAFGFGRRICPGRFMADNSVFAAVASILKVYNISHAKDNNGDQIPVKAAFTSGFLSHPEPFQCAITPRSESAEKILLERADE